MMHRDLNGIKDANDPRSPREASRARTITRVIILTSFCSSFLGSAVNIVIPAISADLSVSAADVGWVITVYALATCGLSVPFGKLADATGRNRIFLIGLSLLAASCLACFFVESFPWMIFLRVLQGTGASMIFATNTAIIVGCHPPQQRGKAIGRMLSGNLCGAGLRAGAFRDPESMVRLAQHFSGGGRGGHAFPDPRLHPPAFPRDRDLPSFLRSRRSF